MVKITLYPFDKIMLDGTEVFLGMEQSDVARAIGEGKKFEQDVITAMANLR